MRDPARIDRMLGRIRRIWAACPDMRLGQLLSNAACTPDGRNAFDVNVFNYEDAALERDLSAFEQSLRLETA